MHEVSMDKAGALVAEQLPKGVFLCVGGDTPNVMTIGWGGLAYYWRRHVFVAPVRQQRFTYPCLKKEMAFTVCIPHPGTMAQEVAQAGTLSGRDGDKFAAIGLKTGKAREVNAPVVEGCALYLECVVRAQNAFTLEQTDEAITQASYSAGDFHELFYGEIVACWAGEEK